MHKDRKIYGRIRRINNEFEFNPFNHDMPRISKIHPSHVKKLFQNIPISIDNIISQIQNNTTNNINNTNNVTNDDNKSNDTSIADELKYYVVCATYDILNWPSTKLRPRWKFHNVLGMRGNIEIEYSMNLAKHRINFTVCFCIFFPFFFFYFSANLGVL